MIKSTSACRAARRFTGVRSVVRSVVVSALVSVVFGTAAILAGCATPPAAPPARTTVVLLPDENGHVGAVLVTPTAPDTSASAPADATQKISNAFTGVTVEPAAPPRVQALGAETVATMHPALLGAQPTKPVSFVLHFLLDKTALTPESQALLPKVLEAAKARKPTEITVFGHADASGLGERNLRLSAERAAYVAKLLRHSDPALDQIDVQSFGDKVPLYRSTSRTPDPRNRRAEIQIL